MASDVGHSQPVHRTVAAFVTRMEGCFTRKSTAFLSWLCAVFNPTDLPGLCSTGCNRKKRKKKEGFKSRFKGLLMGILERVHSMYLNALEAWEQTARDTAGWPKAAPGIPQPGKLLMWGLGAGVWYRASDSSSPHCVTLLNFLPSLEHQFFQWQSGDDNGLTSWSY